VGRTARSCSILKRLNHTSRATICYFRLELIAFLTDLICRLCYFIRVRCLVCYTIVTFTAGPEKTDYTKSKNKTGHDMKLL
jgi:hypothetical protein